MELLQRNHKHLNLGPGGGRGRRRKERYHLGDIDVGGRVILKRIWKEWSRDGVVGIMTTLRTQGTGVRISTRTRGLSLLQLVQTGSEAYPAFNSMGTGFLSRGQSGRSAVMTSQIHLPSTLRMRGAVLPFLLCAFMARKGTVLPFS